jgi:hypothetical protein
VGDWPRRRISSLVDSHDCAAVGMWVWRRPWSRNHPGGPLVGVWRDAGSAVRRGVVGEGRFELPASCSQSRRAAKLRHSPEPPSVAVARTTEIGTDGVQSNVSELTFSPSCFIAEVTALTMPPLPHA